MKNNKKTNIFNTDTKVDIGGKIYIVKRHFSNNRDLKSAIYDVVKNEATRQQFQNKSV